MRPFRFGTRADRVFVTSMRNVRRAQRRFCADSLPWLEILEGRVLLANIIPSAVISSKPDGANFDYTIQLTNSSSSDASIGTFWYSWVPGEDFMATSPISETPPSGWTDSVTNMGPGDGYAILFTSGASADNVQPGSTLAFNFTSADTPDEINGNSVFYPTTPVGTSYVYPVGPFSDGGHVFVVQPAAASLSSIAVTPANPSVSKGGTEQFDAVGTFSDGSTQDLTTAVNWSSATTTVATISNTSGSQGLATAVGTGTSTISAVARWHHRFDGLDRERRHLEIDRGDARQHELAGGRDRAIHGDGDILGQFDGRPDVAGELEIFGHHVGDDQQHGSGDGGGAGASDDLGGVRLDHRVDGSDGDGGGVAIDRGDACEHELAGGRDRAVHGDGDVVRQVDRGLDVAGELEVFGHHVGDDQQHGSGDGGGAGASDDLGGVRRDHRVDGSDGDGGGVAIDRGDACEHELAGGRDRAVHGDGDTVRQVDRGLDVAGELEVFGHHVGDDQQHGSGDGGGPGASDDLGDVRRDHRVDGADGDGGGVAIDRGDAGQPDDLEGSDSAVHSHGHAFRQVDGGS